MGQNDKALRKSAIPYYANIWGYNRNQYSDQAIGGEQASINSSDLQPFQITYGTPSTINPVRVLQPHYGELIECNLQLAFHLATAEAPRQFRVAIGYFSSRYTAQTSYSEDYINADHKLITGKITPYSIGAGGSFSANKLNLLPALYKNGHSLFKEDAFVVLLCFDQAPSTGAGWLLSRFEVGATAQMGLK